MLYSNLNEDELRELITTMISQFMAQFSSGLDEKVNDHIRSCKECKGDLYNFSSTFIKMMMVKEARDKCDSMIIQLHNHANVPINNHCSNFLVPCACPTHSIIENHCCLCQPDKCNKPKMN